MGIDIYAEWRGKNEEEKKAQITGFSVVSGNVGYLREAYHGGPYVTKYLMSESFEKGEAKIRADILIERLPIAVLMSIYREKMVYGKKDPTVISFQDLPKVLSGLFSSVEDCSHEDFVKTITKHHIEYAQKLIKDKALPNYAKSFVDFVKLCELKEKETGEPVLIIASY